MKFNLISVFLALALSPLQGMAIQPITAGSLAQLCHDELASAGGVAEQPCTAYIQGYLAGSAETRIGTGTKPPSDLVQRALATRMGARLQGTSSARYCVPENTGIDQFARQLIEQAGEIDNQAAAGELLLRVLQQHYRCTPG